MELQAIMSAVKHIIANLHINPKARILSDSQWAVNVINQGRKAKVYQKEFEEVKQLIKKY